MPLPPGSPPLTPRGAADLPRPGDLHRPGPTLPGTPKPVAVPEGARLVGTDLDGTLLRSDLGVADATRAAIEAALAAGIEIVYVTGRPPRWLPAVVQATGHGGLAVCANGALVVDLREQRLLHLTAIPPAVAAEVVDRLRELVPGIGFALERTEPGRGGPGDVPGITRVDFDPQFDTGWVQVPGRDRADIHSLLGRGAAIKILAAPPSTSPLDADALLELVAAQFAGRLHITHSGSRQVMVEIVAGEADKGAGLARVAGMLGIDAGDCLGVGDMPNDLPLLAWAGTGYAVANAHERVLQAADHVLPSNEQGGVGLLLATLSADSRGVRG